MNARMNQAARQFVACLYAVLFGVWIAPAGAEESLPKHLQLARDIVANVKPDDNTYSGKPRYIRYPGDFLSSGYTVRTDCLGFIESVLDRALDIQPKFSTKMYPTYGHNIIDWVGGIDRGEMFDKVEHVQDLKAGDFVVHRYITFSEEARLKGYDGHAMIVDAAPKRIEPQVLPKLEGAIQWEVRIIDSAAGPMSNDDTRYVATPGAKNYKEWHDAQRTGAGRGKIYLYTDESGNIVAEAAGFRNSPVWKQDKDRRVVMARIRYEQIKK